MTDEALESALRALRHRDRTSQELDRRLAERGFDPSERRRVLETLQRTGVLDDERYARNRAESLAARGAGDRLIRHELEAAGVGAELVEGALGFVDPELDRAHRIVERRGRSPKTARYLSGRGHAHETVAAVIAGGPGGELP